MSAIIIAISSKSRSSVRKTSELTVFAGSQEFEFEFRSGDKAEQAYTFIVQHMK